MIVRTLAVAAATAALSISAMPTAYAATRTVSDPRGDERPRYDITQATLRNGDRLAGTARVVNLRPGKGFFSFTLSPFNSPDIGFIASSTRTSDGRVTNRLIFVDDLGRRHRWACDMTSHWRFAKNKVSLSLPRSCTRGVTGPLFMTENLGPTAKRSTQDHLKGVRVRRH